MPELIASKEPPRVTARNSLLDLWWSGNWSFFSLDIFVIYGVVLSAALGVWGGGERRKGAYHTVQQGEGVVM